MANLLALEWDQFEARIVVAQRRATGVQIEHAFSVSLAPRDAGETFADANVGERLLAALAARRVGRVETIVAVGRSNIELRRLTLPPAPDEELPEMVRFQALPQFSNLGEDWPLDYFRLASSGGEGQSVLAAAISPQLVEQIEKTCEAAGLAPAGLILRPCAAASLVVQRGGPAAHRIRLLVDMLAEEADLTVLVEREIVLMRTVRLPAGSTAEQAAALVGEIRRTIAAAQNQLGGERVEEIVVCGDQSDHRELTSQASDKLSLPTTSFDPFVGLPRSSELKAHPPEHPGRFAPLLGMVLDEASGRQHAIDFLNPRKRPAPPSHKRLYSLAGTVAGLLVLAVIFAVWLQLAGLKNRRATLSAQSLALDEDVRRAQLVQAKAAAIDVWTGTDVNWLDELAAFSSPDRFPIAEDARLVQWKVAARQTGGGRISLEGRAQGSNVIPEMEELLRDEQHTVRSGPSVNDKEDSRYPWRFEETVDIAPANVKELDTAREIFESLAREGPMSQRERMLGIAVGGLLVLVVGFFVYSTYSGWVQGLRSDISVLETAIGDKDAKVARGHFAGKRLKEFAARSLPGNPEVSRSLYKAWLLNLAESRVKLVAPIVTPGTITPGTNGYKRLSFTVSGQGSLEQFARFLCEFYDADYLHQIRSLRVKPNPETRLLEINLAVEALVLDGAAQASELAPRKSNRFDQQTPEQYVTAILNRNVFGPANRPPALSRISSQRVEADKSLSVKMQASDPDELDKLSFRLAEGSPKGTEISASTGEVKFRTKEKGSYQVTVVASDNGLPAKSASQTFSIEVVAPKPVDTVVRNTPPETPKPRFDDAKFAYVTAIVEVAGRRQLWLTVRTSGEVLKLSEGDKFEVERLKAVVDRIGLADIEVSSLGERRRFTIGDSLAEGAKLPATPPVSGE